MDKIDHIIKLLDFEIERLKSENKQPGWTIWALLGSLAAIIWLLLNQFPQNAPPWRDIFSLIVFISICLDTITFIYKIVLPPEGMSQIGSRFGYTKTVFSSVRASELFELLRSTLLLVILYFSSTSQLYSLPIWLWFGFKGCLSCFALILSLCRMPISLSISPSPYIKTIIVIIILTILILGLLGLTIELFIKNPIPAIWEWRVAGLLFAIMTLLSLLARTQEQSHLLPTLLNLRRDLILEKIDVESAKEQIDIALNGLRVDHIFQEDVSKILWYINDCHTSYKRVSEEMKLMEDIMSRTQSNTAKEDDVTIIKALKHSFDSNLAYARISERNGKDAMEKILKRFRFWERGNPAIHNDLKSIQEKLSCAMARVDSLTNEIKLRAERIRSQYVVENKNIDVAK